MGKEEIAQELWVTVLVVVAAYSAGYAAGATFTAVPSLALGASLHGILLPDVAYLVRMWYINNFTKEMSDEEKLAAYSLTATGCGVIQEIDAFNSMVHLPDLDRNGHMNNARYLRELCFSRRHFFKRLGLWRQLDACKTNAVIAAQTIRYRSEQFLFARFSIQSMIVCYSDAEQCLYLESRFMDKTSGFVAAVHVCKYRLLGKAGLPSKLLRAAGLPVTDLPDSTDRVPFLAHWAAANTASSEELRPHK